MENIIIMKNTNKIVLPKLSIQTQNQTHFMNNHAKMVNNKQSYHED